MTDSSAKNSAASWKLPFFTIWTGQAFSLLGSQLVQFALIWWMTKTTGSATVLATASLVGLLPQVILGPVIGPLVDRWNRRLTMLAADSMVALATLGLALLFAGGWVQIWHVYLLMLVRAIGGAFHWPAMQASTTLMIPEEHFSRVQGLNQMLNGGMNILSAPLGALLLELLPVQGVLAIDVGTALLALLPLLFVHIPQPVRTALPGSPDNKPSFWQDFRAGLRYTFGWPGLVVIGMMGALINLLLTPAFSLTAILVLRHFDGQAWQLAWLESAVGVGVIAGGLSLSAWGGLRNRIATSLLGLIGVGAGCLLVGFTPAALFYLAVAAVFLVGFSLPVANGPLLAAVQAAVAPDMQGRVFTLIGSVSAAMSPLGLMIAGPVADRFGVQTWFILGGLMTLAMALLGFMLPVVMNFEQQKNGAAAPEIPPQQVLAVEPVEVESDVLSIR